MDCEANQEKSKQMEANFDREKSLKKMVDATRNLEHSIGLRRGKYCFIDFSNFFVNCLLCPFLFLYRLI